MTRKDAFLLIKDKNCEHIRGCYRCFNSPVTVGCPNSVRKILIDRLVKGECLTNSLTKEELIQLKKEEMSS